MQNNFCRNLIVVVLMALLGLFFTAIGQARATQQDINVQIKSEIISAVEFDRCVDLKSFSDTDLRKYFAPIFRSKIYRDKWYGLLENRLTENRKDSVRLVYEPRSSLNLKAKLKLELARRTEALIIDITEEGKVKCDDYELLEELKHISR